MLSKDTLIAWLDAHGLLTADVELDVHDGFAAARRAVAAMPVRTKSRALPWLPRPAGLFFAVCRHLDAEVAAGRLDPGEAVVALHLLRAAAKALHQEITVPAPGLTGPGGAPGEKDTTARRAPARGAAPSGWVTGYSTFPGSNPMAATAFFRASGSGLPSTAALAFSRLTSTPVTPGTLRRASVTLATQCLQGHAPHFELDHAFRLGRRSSLAWARSRVPA